MAEFWMERSWRGIEAPFLLQDRCCSSESCWTDLWSRRSPSHAAAVPSRPGPKRGRRRLPRPSGGPARGLRRVHPACDSRVVVTATRRRSLRRLLAVAFRQTRPGSAAAHQLRRAFDDIRGQGGRGSERSVLVQQSRPQPSTAQTGGSSLGLPKQPPKSQKAGRQLQGRKLEKKPL